MTISSTTRKAGPFTGNGVTAAFPFAYKVFTAADLLVVQADTATGVETTLALATNYTVALNADQSANPGGVLTMVVAPPSGTTLVLTSQVANLQPIDVTNGGGFYPSILNAAFDRATIQIQQLSEKVGRALKTAISTPAGVSSDLPAPAAYKTLAWNSTATALENIDPSGSSSLSVALAASGGAALVGYTPAGAGAVATTVQAKLRESVSVKDFGAVGDGVTDDTAAILAALTYLKPTGGKLNFPLGTYLTDQIDLTTFNNIELCGVTDSTEFPWNSPTVIKIRTACDVGIKTSQTGVEVPTTFGKMVTIKNLYINANSLAVVGVNCKASTKLTNVIVRYATSHGILFEGESYPVTLDHVVSQYNGGDGLRINPALTTVYSLSHCEFDYNSGNGLQILGGSTCLFNSVIAQGNAGSGFLIQMLDPSGFVNPIFLSALTFIGCYTEANGFYGLYVTSYNTNPATFVGKIPNLTFIGCSFNSSIGQQVYIRGTSTLKAINTYDITDVVVSPLYNTVNLDVEYMFTQLNLASGQIKFPATQNPSADPNTIDDYKEGTWTPIATALTIVGTPTYAGSYTKIGRLVVATITITSTTSTASTHGNTSFTLPLSAAHDSALCNANIGFGITNAPGGFVTGSVVYSPTWAASNHVELSFSYFTA